jgi:eukaryotic-like serine/threonine-protein kinase
MIGTVLLGKYRVDEVLGMGGMGVVVRGVHLELGTQVAIKHLLPHMASNAGVVQRFLREAQATVRLRGAHVAKVIDVGKLDDGSPFMVMEYLAGADLGQVLRAHGAQPPPVACDLMLQVCEGMAEAHAIGIVHRDVKPSNFFVTRSPDGSPLVKILDFGISKVPLGTELQLTGTQAMVGTPAFMAPEQMRSATKADHRSDLWSIGVVLYQLLTNRLPFEGESFTELCLRVTMEAPMPFSVPLPPGLGEVVLRCMEKDPARRFPSVAHLAFALAPFCTDPVAANAAAERASRILEAPRGPRAPTLAVSDAKLAAAAPLTGQARQSSFGAGPGTGSGYGAPAGGMGIAHPTSVSAGVGEYGGMLSGLRRSPLALYVGAGAAVLLLGIGFGVYAANRGEAKTEVQPAALVRSEPATPSAAEQEQAAKEEAERVAAEAAAAAAKVRAAAEAAERGGELQGGIATKPAEAEGKPTATTDATPAVQPADEAEADDEVEPTDARASSRSKRDSARKSKTRTATTKKKKKSGDLFNSRE